MKDRSSIRAPRTRTDLPALLVDAHGTKFVVTIIDLSADGFRLRTRERLDAGEQVSLHSGKGEGQPARIMWVRDGEAGGMFLQTPELPR